MISRRSALAASLAKFKKLRGKEVNITNFDAAKKKQLQDDLKAKLEEQQECGKLRARLRCWLYKLEIEKRTKKAKEDQFHSSRIGAIYWSLRCFIGLCPKLTLALVRSVFGKCRLKCCNLTNNTVHQNNGDGDDCNNGCCTNILVVALEKILACIGDAAEAARRLKNSDDKEDYKNILPLALKTSMSLISHAVKLVRQLSAYLFPALHAYLLWPLLTLPQGLPSWRGYLRRYLSSH